MKIEGSKDYYESIANRNDILVKPYMQCLSKDNIDIVNKPQIGVPFSYNKAKETRKIEECSSNDINSIFLSTCFLGV